RQPLYRNSEAQGRIPGAHHLSSRAAERTGADRGGGGAQPRLSHRRRRRRRGRFRLSGDRPADGRFGFGPRHPGRPGLRPDLRHDLHLAQSAGGHRIDRHQPKTAAPAMSAAPDSAGIAPAAPESPRRFAAFWRAARRAPVSARLGLIIIALYVFCAVFAPLLAPYGESQIVGNQYEVWGGTYAFGTDQLGRDMLSRLIYGARNTVGIAVLTTAISFTLGGMLGLLAALPGRPSHHAPPPPGP